LPVSTAGTVAIASLKSKVILFNIKIMKLLAVIARSFTRGEE
jgi:hypothetical protein